jgi:hypothetical protein
MGDRLWGKMKPRQLLLEPNYTASARRPSFGRAFLAVLIACAISLSFFHGWTANAEADELPVAATITASDASSQAPIQHAPAHADHCLTHLVSTLAQVAVVVPIQFEEAVYPRRAEVLPPDRAGVSPFKPPCA